MIRKTSQEEQRAAKALALKREIEKGLRDAHVGRFSKRSIPQIAAGVRLGSVVEVKI